MRRYCTGSVLEMTLKQPHLEIDGESGHSLINGLLLGID